MLGSLFIIDPCGSLLNWVGPLRLYLGFTLGLGPVEVAERERDREMLSSLPHILIKKIILHQHICENFHIELIGSFLIFFFKTFLKIIIITHFDPQKSYFNKNTLH